MAGTYPADLLLPLLGYICFRWIVKEILQRSWAPPLSSPTQKPTNTHECQHLEVLSWVKVVNALREWLRSEMVSFRSDLAALSFRLECVPCRISIRHGRVSNSAASWRGPLTPPVLGYDKTAEVTTPQKGHSQFGLFFNDGSTRRISRVLVKSVGSVRTRFSIRFWSSPRSTSTGSERWVMGADWGEGSMGLGLGFSTGCSTFEHLAFSLRFSSGGHCSKERQFDARRTLTW